MLKHVLAVGRLCGVGMRKREKGKGEERRREQNRRKIERVNRNGEKKRERGERVCVCVREGGGPTVGFRRITPVRQGRSKTRLGRRDEAI